MTKSYEGRDPAAERDPAAIESEIAQTRAEISERLNAIGEKLSPEQLKQEAKQALGEVKENVAGRLREAKDTALERARYAGEVSYGYARENAIPLGLIGLGIGWLLVSGSRRKSAERYGSWRDERVPYGSYGARDEPAWSEPSAFEQTSGSARRAVDETRNRAGEMSERAKRRLEEGVDRARQSARDLGRRSSELGHRAREQALRVERDARDLARENPLAVGAAALAVGVGIGLLLPSTHPEDELLGERRDRLIGDLRDSVEGVGRAAKDTARDVQGALREGPRT